MVVRRTGVLLVAFAILLAIPRLSLAQTGGPCHDDIQRLCKDAGPGGVPGCLHQHASELSPACKARIGEAKERAQKRRAELKQACQGDLEKYCSKTEPGKLRIAQCLRANEAQLSPGCKAVLAERPARKGGTPAAPAAAPTVAPTAAPKQ